MSETVASKISKEMLKTALIELAQSDRDFLVSLVADALKDAAPVQGAAAPKAASKRKKPESGEPVVKKIIPSYRPKNLEELLEKYELDKSVLLELRKVFADAPPAEELIAALTK